MVIEKITLNENRNVTLTAFLQDVGGEFPNITKRPAILILPGGGYRMCSDREAEPVAMTYLHAGFQAFVLRYSVQEHATWPNPLEDYEQAMALIRSKADEWNLYPDKVAVIGFSAGGHLAAAGATMAENRPNAAILGYPVTEGPSARSCEPSAPDVVSAVDQKTCPCFVFATRTDPLVPIRNSLNFVAALAMHDISFESHIYAYGPHGFSVGNSSVLKPGTEICSRAVSWVNDSVAWLKDILGDFGDGAMTESKCKRCVNDDYEDYLSVDCTVEHLMTNSQAIAVLAPLMNTVQSEMADKYADKVPNRIAAGAGSNLGLGAKMTLRSALSMANAPAQMVEQLNTAIRKIPNNTEQEVSQ